VCGCVRLDRSSRFLLRKQATPTRYRATVPAASVVAVLNEGTGYIPVRRTRRKLAAFISQPAHENARLKAQQLEHQVPAHEDAPHSHRSSTISPRLPLQVSRTLPSTTKDCSTPRLRAGTQCARPSTSRRRGRAVAVSPSGEYRLNDSLEAAQAAQAAQGSTAPPHRVFVDRFMREQGRPFYSKPDAPE